MANLLRWSFGLSLPKKKEENNVLATPATSLIKSLRTMNPATNNSNQANTAQAAGNNAFLRFQQINDQIRQQAEERRRQEEQRRQQQIAEAQRQQEQRKQQEEARRQQQQQALQQKQNNLLSSAGLGNNNFNTSNFRANLEAQNQARIQKQQQEAEAKNNTWKKYYDEEKQKVRDQAFKNNWGESTLQDIFNAGWDSRLAETNARNRYTSELMGQGKTEEAKKHAAETMNVARQYGEQERSNSRALGASYDSDYKDNPFLATFNAVRRMDVGNAMTGGAEGGAADVLKFGLNLLPGMFSAPISGTANVSEALAGKGLDQQTGKMRELTGLERGGRFLSGAVDAAGVLYGGSGDFLNAMANKLFKKGAEEATKQAVKQTSKEVVKGYLKAMLEEGSEEAVQQAFEFFGDGGTLTTADGKFDTDSFKELLAESAQAGALGAAGGGLFHAGSRAIGRVGNAINNRKANINSNLNNNLVNGNVNEDTNFTDNANTNVNEETNIDPARVQTTQDGTMVKTNTDGTATKLSDAELTNVIEQKSTLPTVSGTNPFINNSVNLGTSEDLNTLAKRAEQGDTYAQERLAELTGQNEEENTGWQGKSVEEVINPEDTKQLGIDPNLLAPQMFDKNGNLLVMYHGTPNGGFTRFNDGSYFTPDLDYASRYLEPSASSMGKSGLQTQNNPMVYNTYLDIRKPFDLNDPVAKTIFINDYIKGKNSVGISPYLSDAEYQNINNIDWTEVENLREFLQENGYDYDSIIADEGADLVNGEVVPRGRSFIPFSGDQVRIIQPSTNNDVNTNESPEILDNERAIDDEDEDIAADLAELYGPMEEKTQVAPSYDEDLSMQKIEDVVEGKTSFDDYVGDQRELLWKSFKDSNRGGVESFLVQDPESNDYQRRISTTENGTLYRQLYQEYGGRPTKAEFNEALNDVLINGKDSKYYRGFREFDHDGETSAFEYNKGNENIDLILELKEEMDNQKAQARKEAQYKLLQETNPMTDDYHTGIRSANEINTLGELVGKYDPDSMFTYPDFTIDDARKAVENGVLPVYSSKPIESGTFITPSKMMATDYAGGDPNGVYSQEIPIDDFAAIESGDEGNYLPVQEERSSEQQEFDAQMPRGEVNSISEVIDTPAGKNSFVTLLRGVSDKVRNVIKKAVGVDVAGYNHTIDSSSIKHALKKHANDAIPLRVEDFNLVEDILKNADNVEYSGKNRRGLDTITYKKQYGDRVAYVEEIRNGRHQLVMNTMYWEGRGQQKSTPAGEFSDNSTNSVRALSRPAGSASETNVPQNSKNVNGRSYETEVDTLPEDFDVKHYVTDQTKAQKERSKLPLRERISDVTAELKHYLVDDAVAYERYIKDKNERLNIREGVDRVRSSDMIARQYMIDNKLGEVVNMPEADLNEFQQYLIAKRALEVAEQGKATGRSKAADQALIDAVGDKYAKQEQIIRDYTRGMLKYSADNGLISQKLKDDLIKNNPNYVPMNRVFDVLEKKTGFKSKQLGNLSNQSVVQKMTGSERVVENPIESLMANTLRMVNEVERNNTAKLIAKSNAFHEKTLAEGEKPRPGYDALNYMVDGKKVSYEVPELVAKEMKNLNNVLPKAAENILKVAGAPTRWLRSGATQNNPIFAVSNLLRDQMQTVVTGKVSSNLKGTKDALVATFSPTKRGKDLRAELNRAGIIGSEYRQTYGYKSGDLMAQLQADNKLSKGVKNKLKHPIDAIGDLIGRTEYFTRAQQYFGTDGDATTKAQAARNNTLNFNRAGSATRILNRIIPFLNAGVQGGRITVNSFKNRPVHTTLAIASLAGIALAAKGAAEAQDKELWDRIDESDKGQNIIIFTPNAHYDGNTNRVEGIIKIPVAQMLYPVMDATNNLKGDPSDLTMLAGDIFTATTGIEAPTEEKGFLPVVNQLTPTAVKPFLEASMNKSTYTGNEIVSEYDSNKNPEDKGAKYTTGLARTIAKATGVDAPVVDNFIQNWGGGLAKDLSKVMTDNPDNKSDGGGIGKMFENGFNRRFLSGTVESQYEIAEGLAKNYKKEIKNSEAFKSLSSENQQKVLNAIDNDMKGIASVSTKVEQGKANDKTSLTKRQTEIVANGFNSDSYINAVTDKKATYSGSGQNGAGQTLNGNVLDYGKTAVRNNPVEISDSISGDSKSILSKYNSMKSDDWNKYIYGTSEDSAAAEYKLALAKYENDLANGKINDAQKVKKEKELAKLAVSQKWTKDYRDAYSLAGTKADMQAYLNGLDAETRKKTVSTLNGLNNAMYEAGIISASTYKTRYNAINNTTSKKSGGRKRSSGKSSKSEGISSAEASALASLAKTMTKGDDGVKIKTPEAPETKRKMSKTKSSGNKTGLATYTPSSKKSISVSRGAKRSIA